MNRNPSPKTRFGNGNPGRSPKPPQPPLKIMQESPSGDQQIPNQVQDPRSLPELLVAKLMAIIDDPASDPDRVIRAIRLLCSEDMKPGVQEVLERSRREAHRTRMIPLLAISRETIAGEYPGVDSEEVEEFLRQYSELMMGHTDYEAGEQFFNLAVDYGWATKEEIEAARATEAERRAARIKTGGNPLNPDGKAALG